MLRKIFVCTFMLTAGQALASTENANLQNANEALSHAQEALKLASEAILSATQELEENGITPQKIVHDANDAVNNALKETSAAREILSLNSGHEPTED